MKSNHSTTRVHLNNGINGKMKTNIHSNGRNNRNGRKRRGRGKKDKVEVDNNHVEIYEDNYNYEYNNINMIEVNTKHDIKNNDNNIYIDNDDDDDDDIIDIEFDTKDDKKDKKEKTDCELLWENLEWEINNEDEFNIDKYIDENINGCKEYIETNFKLDNNDNLIQKNNTVPIGIHMLNTFAIKYPPACQCIKETL